MDLKMGFSSTDSRVVLHNNAGHNETFLYAPVFSINILAFFPRNKDGEIL